MIRVQGKNLQQLDLAAGGHRVQRVPPTERRGRVHTSTVTVAILDPTSSPKQAFSLYNENGGLNENDLRIEWFSGSGAGGQHRNKHQNSCRVIHEPTGIMEARQGRKRETNLREAKAALLVRLEADQRGQSSAAMAATRNGQVGSGMRGDTTVTLRFQDDRVQHHVTGKTMKASKFMKGHMDELWK